MNCEMITRVLKITHVPTLPSSISFCVTSKKTWHSQRGWLRHGYLRRFPAGESRFHLAATPLPPRAAERQRALRNGRCAQLPTAHREPPALGIAQSRPPSRRASRGPTCPIGSSSAAIFAEFVEYLLKRRPHLARRAAFADFLQSFQPCTMVCRCFRTRRLRLIHHHLPALRCHTIAPMRPRMRPRMRHHRSRRAQRARFVRFENCAHGSERSMRDMCGSSVTSSLAAAGVPARLASWRSIHFPRPRWHGCEKSSEHAQCQNDRTSLTENPRRN